MVLVGSRVVGAVLGWFCVVLEWFQLVLDGSSWFSSRWRGSGVVTVDLHLSHVAPSPLSNLRTHHGPPVKKLANHLV